MTTFTYWCSRTFLEEIPAQIFCHCERHDTGVAQSGLCSRYGHCDQLRCYRINGCLFCGVPDPKPPASHVCRGCVCTGFCTRLYRVPEQSQHRRARGSGGSCRRISFTHSEHNHCARCARGTSAHSVVCTRIWRFTGPAGAGNRYAENHLSLRLIHLADGAVRGYSQQLWKVCCPCFHSGISESLHDCRGNLACTLDG